jgi:putative nucleotidyltransferase with HDIG domain
LAAVSVSKTTSSTKIPLLKQMIEIIEEDPNVSALPAASHELLVLCQKEDVALEDISAVVEVDPGLTAKYLRLANSSAFYSQEKISNIQDALLRIGLDEARNLAYSIIVVNACNKFLNKSAPKKTPNYWESVWMHNVMTARLTQTIADSYRPPMGNEYLAGLLHDVGKLFLETFFPDEYHRIVQASKDYSSLFKTERALCDTDHAEIGWLLCRKWSLDDELTIAIRVHHHPAFADPRKNEETAQIHFLGACVCFANAVSKLELKPDSDTVDYHELPEWEYLLENFPPRKPLNLNLQNDLETTKVVVGTILGSLPG